MERRVREVRVYEGMDIVFVFNDVMWTAVRREELAGARVPRVVVVGRDGRRRMCHDATVDEALRGECGA
jgi:hypothetical protein